MALIEVERAGPTGAGKDTALRDWVRALEATAPIAAHPRRTLRQCIEELAETLATRRRCSGAAKP